MSDDEFAQTRAPDDLFDDDFTPVAEPTRVLSSSIHAPSGPRAEQHQPRGGRGRGRGRGRGGGEAAAESRADGPAGEKAERKEGGGVKDGGAVRGDRTATGGVVKPKLTEEELSARLESIRLKNVALEEAHRRAEADEASFHEREQRELAKRVEERANRRVLEGEREKNRQRKLKAVQGREWDAEKKEDDYAGGRGGGAYSRGAHGGVVGGRGEGSQRGGYDGHGGEGRERGDFLAPRGPRGGAGRGRGGHENRGRGGHGRGQPRQPSPSQQNPVDFPALPAASAPESDSIPSLPGASDQQSSASAPKLAFPIQPAQHKPVTTPDTKPPSSDPVPSDAIAEKSTAGKPPPATAIPSKAKSPPLNGSRQQSNRGNRGSAPTERGRGRGRGQSQRGDSRSQQLQKEPIPSLSPLASPTGEKGSWAEQMETPTV